ncbi:unnamed protein product, partial [Timema podura]|nr:unnamed protein product [Timema podura]
MPYPPYPPIHRGEQDIGTEDHSVLTTLSPVIGDGLSQDMQGDSSWTLRGPQQSNPEDRSKTTRGCRRKTPTVHSTTQDVHILTILREDRKGEIWEYSRPGISGLVVSSRPIGDIFFDGVITGGDQDLEIVSLIRYMYTGEATVGYEELDYVLKAARILEIKGLSREKISTESINLDNKLKDTLKRQNIPQCISDIEQSVQIVKQEPEWEPLDVEEIEEHCSKDPMHTEITIKPEFWDARVISDGGIDSYQITHILKEEIFNSEDGSSQYTPLSCDFCHKMFTSPAEWVRHIESHPETKEHSKQSKKNRVEIAFTAITAENLPEFTKNDRHFLVILNPSGDALLQLRLLAGHAKLRVGEGDPARAGK